MSRRDSLHEWARKDAQRMIESSRRDQEALRRQAQELIMDSHQMLLEAQQRREELISSWFDVPPRRHVPLDVAPSRPSMLIRLMAWFGSWRDSVKEKRKLKHEGRPTTF